MSGSATGGAGQAEALFQERILANGVRVCVYPTKKLKTILVRVHFRGDLDGTVTARTVIPMVLRRGTSRLPDMKAITRYLENLYGAGLHTGVSKVGEWHVNNFSLEVVNDSFLPGRPAVLPQGLRFLADFLFDPLTDEGPSFVPAYVEVEKNNLRRLIDGLINDKGEYAFERCIREMCRDEPYRIYRYGDVADLEALDAKGLHGMYRGWVDRYPMAVYMAGDVEAPAAFDALAETFGRPREGGYEPKPLPRSSEVGEPRTVVETMDVQQGKLCMGYRHGVTYGDPGLAAMVVMNGVLGGFPHSKLFQNVREKQSLCYYVHSSLDRTKGLLFIASGIDFGNFERAVDIIGEELRGIGRGDFSEEELSATKQSILNRILMIEDDIPELAEVVYVWQLHGCEFTLEAYRDQVMRVTRDEVAAAAQRAKLDMVYFLKR